MGDVLPGEAFAARSSSPRWEELVLVAKKNNLTIMARFIPSQNNALIEVRVNERGGRGNCFCELSETIEGAADGILSEWGERWD